VDRQVVAGAGLPRQIGPYSHAVRAGGMVYVSGQPGIDPQTGEKAGETFAEQAGQAFANLAAVLGAAGSGLDRVVSTTVLVADQGDFATLNALFAETFPVDPPTRMTMQVPLPLGLLISVGATATTEAASPAEDRSVLSDERRQAILRPAVDYIESWLDGDPDRMADALHPDLVKREIVPGPDGEPVVESMSRDDMVAATAQGYGRKYERPYDAEVLDVFHDIATVRVLSSIYLDYLHVGLFGDRWLIVNVLWQRRPGR
jgi:2-iminobutanoate/2-iminopropanoate deaminase